VKYKGLLPIDVKVVHYGSVPGKSDRYSSLQKYSPSAQEKGIKRKGGKEKDI